MPAISYWRLCRLLTANGRLALRRHPLWESNRTIKWLLRFVAAYYILCLFIPGVLLGYYSHNGTGRETFDEVDGIMVIFLAIDFLVRFFFFETPAQTMKAFKLLPVPQRWLLQAYLTGIGTSAFNLLWMALLVPLGLLGIMPYVGWTALVGWLIGWWLLMVMNGYWYTFCRTLILRHWLWSALPLAIYATLIYFGLFCEPLDEFLFNGCMALGRGWLGWQVWALLIPIAGIALLFAINVPLQRKMAYRELAQEESSPSKQRVSPLFSNERDDRQVHPYKAGVLDHFGIYGEYLRLELLSIRRNKTIRTQFISLVVCMLFLCALLSFSSVYDAPTMRCFILVYCFYGMGGTQVLQLMQAEGNYIDLLMSRRESVLTLLKAKYLFFGLLLLLPLLVLIAPMCQGKLHPLEVLGFALFTLGIIFPVLFNTAVYNKQTLPLNHKLTKQGANSNHQIVISLAALLVPTILLRVMSLLLPVWVEGLVLSVLGLLGIALSPWWIRNVYNRLMLRRHANMEGFRQSRQAM